MRVTISVTRPVILIRQRRVSNRASRQKDSREARRRRRSMSQWAAALINRGNYRGNWLAVALLHEVRSEARWSLCALIRFSAWPLAQ